MFHINKQLVSSPSSSTTFSLIPPLSPLSPGAQRLLAHAHTVTAGRCVLCVHRCVPLVCTCAMKATCWVSLALKVSWADDTVTHVSTEHPVQSAIICNHLLTHTHKSNIPLSIYSFLLWREGRACSRWQAHQSRLTEKNAKPLLVSTRQGLWIQLKSVKLIKRLRNVPYVSFVTKHTLSIPDDFSFLLCFYSF